MHAKNIFDDCNCFRVVEVLVIIKEFNCTIMLLVDLQCIEDWFEVLYSAIAGNKLFNSIKGRQVIEMDTDLKPSELNLGFRFSCSLQISFD